jgi:hypothetical protein
LALPAGSTVERQAEALSVSAAGQYGTSESNKLLAQMVSAEAF